MNIVDVLFHVHPELSEEQRINIEETLSSDNGVMHVQFDTQVGHELNVSYDPDAIRVETLLEQIRDWDDDVKMIRL